MTSDEAEKKLKKQVLDDIGLGVSKSTWRRVWREIAVQVIRQPIRDLAWGIMNEFRARAEDPVRLHVKAVKL